MTRSRRSAKEAGTKFERLIANYLATVLDDDRIDRRPKNGNKDRGDIGGVRRYGPYHESQCRIVIECKDAVKPKLAGWAAEAEVERGNDDALVGVVTHKRHGNAKAADQWVTMTMANFVALLTGERPQEIATVSEEETAA